MKENGIELTDIGEEFRPHYIPASKLFATMGDDFARGWERAKTAAEIHIAINAVWSAVDHNGVSTFSYEKVDSHRGIMFLQGAKSAIESRVTDCEITDHR